MSRLDRFFFFWFYSVGKMNVKITRRILTFNPVLKINVKVIDGYTF